MLLQSKKYYSLNHNYYEHGLHSWLGVHRGEAVGANPLWKAKKV